MSNQLLANTVLRLALWKNETEFDCLIYEKVFIKQLKSKLNTQSDSISAKLFEDIKTSHMASTTHLV